MHEHDLTKGATQKEKKEQSWEHVHKPHTSL